MIGHLEIKQLDNGRMSVKVDGKEIGNKICRVSFDATSAMLPTVIFECRAKSIDINCDSLVDFNCPIQSTDDEIEEMFD